MTMTDLETENKWVECDGTEVAGAGKRTLGLYSIRAKCNTSIGRYQLEKSLYDDSWWYFTFYGYNGDRKFSGLAFGEDTPTGFPRLMKEAKKWADADFIERTKSKEPVICDWCDNPTYTVDAVPHPAGKGSFYVCKKCKASEHG